MSASSDQSLKVLAPAGGPGGLDAFLERASRPSCEPFAQSRIEILGALSKRILSDRILRRDPGSVALAYWLRPGNLLPLVDAARERLAAPNSHVVPAGLVFHIAPSNVDTMFVYSWALSFLCGNGNVVRLSTRGGEIVDAVGRVLSELMKDSEELAGSNWFVQYPRESEVTATVSRACGQRVIWGGDETIRRIRSVELNPHAGERCFSSKYSYAILDIKAVIAAEDKSAAVLGDSLFLDISAFQQAACSSPHLVFLRGDPKCLDEALQRLGSLLDAAALKRGVLGDAGLAVRRIEGVFDLALSKEASLAYRGRGFTLVRGMSDEKPSRVSCGAGLLTAYHVEDFRALSEFAISGDQSVSHFGLTEEEVRELSFSLGMRGVDRVVPVGEALAFEPVWDGFDLFSDFTRKVVFR